MQQILILVLTVLFSIQAASLERRDDDAADAAMAQDAVINAASFSGLSAKRRGFKNYDNSIPLEGSFRPGHNSNNWLPSNDNIYFAEGRH